MVSSLQYHKGTRIMPFHRGIKKQVGGSSLDPTFKALFETPTQSNITQGSASLFFPLNDSAPGTSIEEAVNSSTLNATGTPTSITHSFNTEGKGVYYANNCYHSGTVSADLGTSDCVIEFFCRFIDAGGGGIMGCNTAGGNPLWEIDVTPSLNWFKFLIKDGAGTEKSSNWSITPDKFGVGTWHHVKLEIDRDSDANTKLFIDGIQQTSKLTTDLDDHSAVDVGGTNFVIGARASGVAFKVDAELAQIKITYGAFTGATPSFEQGLDVAVGATSLSFTRATLQSTEHEVYNTGASNIQTQLAGNPALGRDDATADDKEGILLERTTTNYALRSRQFNNASWTKTNVTVTADNTDGPDDTARADKLVAGAANGTVDQTTGLAVGVGKKCIFSVWLKADSGTFDKNDLVLELEDSGGPAATASALLDAETGSDATVGTTWKRCYVFYNFLAGAAGNVVCRIKMITNGLTVYADMAQMEYTLYTCFEQPSSFVYTTTASATRNSCQLTHNVSEIGNKYTVLMMWQAHGNSDDVGSGGVWYDANAGGWGDVRLGQFNDDTLSLRFGGTSITGAGTYSYGDWIQIGCVIDTENDVYKIILNGAAVASDTTAKTNPTYTDANIGYDTTQSLCMNGNYAEFRIYKNYALSDAQCNTVYTEQKATLGI